MAGTTDFNTLSPEDQEKAIEINKILILRGIIDKDSRLELFLDLQHPVFIRGMLASGHYPLDSETLRVIQ
jgi:hypothetical protein